MAQQQGYATNITMTQQASEYEVLGDPGYEILQPSKASQANEYAGYAQGSFQQQSGSSQNGYYDYITPTGHGKY